MHSGSASNEYERVATSSGDNREIPIIEEEALPEGFIEEKVQIDRRKLEAMITGNCHDQKLPSAFQFFPTIEKETGTRISWPSKLKIGAKTKKDPFVKIVGFPENVSKAKEAISGLLKVKKDRITLKMEIGHTSHSHIIGRGGKNTQDVMRETSCHIHFPDSNKHNDVEKNNQVSIAGGVAQVERARTKLRLISPIALNINVEVNPQISVNCNDLQRKLACSEFSCQLSIVNSVIQLTIKGSVQNEDAITNTINKFLNLLTSIGYSTNSAICLSSFDLRPTLLQPNYGLFSLNTIRWIAFHTKTQMQFSPQGSSILVMGAAPSVFAARRYLTGLLPVSIQFEKPADAPLIRQNIRTIETKYNVNIGEKKKSNGNGSELLTVVRSYEANISNVYAARQQLLQSDPSEAIHVYEYAFMQNFLEKVKDSVTPKPGNPSSQSILDIDTHSRPSSCLPLFSECRNHQNFSIPNSFEPLHSDRSSPVFLELCKSRDPELPKGSLSDKSKNEIWRAPGLERQLAMDREKMLLKANQATYTQEITDVRQPTDLWSGYGFSNSLPADILKLGLKQIWEQPENTEYGFGATTSISKEMKTGRTAVDNKGKGLASVREEEELSDYTQSLSSNFSSPSQTTKDFPLPSIFKRPTFAASAGVFESTPSSLNNDISWDIEIFVDPAMVLSQLGCSEYLPQFRDQEVDMQAFLLLDEQNLKDIGVSTMGARKKIFNAILKLRDSARKHGYSI